MINISLAGFPGYSFIEAMGEAMAGVTDPHLGSLVLMDTQLCPQNGGVPLTVDLAAELRERYPGTRFRLHANVQVLSRRQITDLDRFDAKDNYWQTLARISQALDAPAYTAHAGRREFANFDTVIENTRRAADLFGCPVGIEGHYPTAKQFWLIDSWRDYARLLESKIDYVVDLSHINIVARWSRRVERRLVEELLASEHCLEVHVSGNDGRSDQHTALRGDEWWLDMLRHCHPRATVFSETQVQSKHRRAAAA